MTADSLAHPPALEPPSGQLTTDDVETGDEVRPVHADELREPGAETRDPSSQDWDGYRFEPV